MCSLRKGDGETIRSELADALAKAPPQPARAPLTSGSFGLVVIQGSFDVGWQDPCPAAVCRANCLSTCMAGYLERPSLCILAIRVVRGNPSLAAAPPLPPTTQLVSRSVAMMWARSASARVRT